MAGEMTVDQLLSQQRDVKPLATIEPVPDNPDSVKVTPWLRATGCLCSLSLIVPKAVIESVKPTGESHYCCGKRLEVVEITFKKGAQLPVTDVFAQAAAAASSAQPTQQTTAQGHHHHDHSHAPIPTGGGYGYPRPTASGYGMPSSQLSGAGVLTFPGFSPMYSCHCHTRGSCDRDCMERLAPACIAVCSVDPTGAGCAACLGIWWGTCCSKWLDCHCH